MYSLFLIKLKLGNIKIFNFYFDKHNLFKVNVLLLHLHLYIYIRIFYYCFKINNNDKVDKEIMIKLTKEIIILFRKGDPIY